MANIGINAAKRPRNILSLSTEEKRIFLDSFDHVFSDIDGVLWNMEHSIDGAAAGLNDLQSVGKKVTFVTNNSVRPIQNYVQRFQDLHLDVNMETDFFHPAKNIVNYLQSIHFDGLIYIIATENFKKFLSDAGFRLIDGPTKILEESFAVLAQNVFDREPVRAVVIDVDFNLSSPKLIRAHLYLRNPECLLIAGATDMLLPVRKSISILGPGPFAKVLDEASVQQMITLGKPGKDLANLLVKTFDIQNKSRALMIGDMLEQDVGFGKQCGFQTLLVLSGGCTRQELEAQGDPKLLPDYFAESLGDFVHFIKSLNKSKA